MKKWFQTPRFRATFYFIASIVSILLYYFKKNISISQYGIEEYLEIISLLTFFAAFLIGWRELRMDIRNELPKLLTVRFLFDGNLLMLCKNADLSHESDIRAWSQQIGGQMSGDFNLKFKPNFNYLKEKRPVDFIINGKKHWYVRYLYEVNLISEPLFRETSTKSAIANKNYLMWDVIRNNIGDNFKPIPNELPHLLYSESL